MEHAPLRPLPSRHTRPADPDLARRYVGARLPGLDPAATSALALVELAHVERDQAALELGLGPDGIGEALARARKELRRSRHALAGSGWCERAERLISERLDGELAALPAKRLDAHLRNCPRCVEHELRLIQAVDELADGMPAPLRPAAALRLVLPATQALPPGTSEAELEPPPEEPALEAAPEPPELEVAPEEPALERAPEEPALEPAPDEPALAPAPEPGSEPPPRVAPPRRGAAPPPQPDPPPRAQPVPPRPLADPRPVSALIVAFTWHIAFALAVLLAIASVAITVIGIGGGRI